MSTRLPLVVTIVGVFFTLQGFGWLFMPELAASQLGMQLLDGLGRSTQVGDFTAFFFVLGIGILVGSRPHRAHVLYFPAAMLGSAALFRTLAWVWHGADFAALFIGVEIAAAVLLVYAAREWDTPGA